MPVEEQRQIVGEHPAAGGGVDGAVQDEERLAIARIARRLPPHPAQGLEAEGEGPPAPGREDPPCPVAGERHQGEGGERQEGQGGGGRGGWIEARGASVREQVLGRIVAPFGLHLAQGGDAELPGGHLYGRGGEPLLAVALDRHREARHFEGAGIQRRVETLIGQAQADQGRVALAPLLDRDRAQVEPVGDRAGLRQRGALQRETGIDPDVGLHRNEIAEEVAEGAGHPQLDAAHLRERGHRRRNGREQEDEEERAHRHVVSR